MLDWFPTESAVFWKNDPNAPPPSEIETEVFFIPAASSTEKEGTLTNTQRLLQWHDKALDPPDDCRSDAWFVYDLGKRLRRLYAGSTDPRDQPLLNLTWDYDHDEPPRLPDGSISRIEGEPDVEKVLQEINGHKLDEIDAQTGRPRLLERLLRAERRRHDGLRLLDLQRRLSPSRAATGPASARARPTTRSSRNGASPGRTTAGSCTTAPRPTPRAGRGPSARS